MILVCALVMCGAVGVYAADSIEKEEKDLSPGVLVCNGKEDKCTKEREQEESASSILFSAFCKDKEDEIKLLACKDCR